MAYDIRLSNAQYTIIQKIARRRGVLHTPRIAPICNLMAVFANAFHAVAFRAYAIRHCKWRKNKIGCTFPNTPKTTSDVRKTTSDVEKIMSDVV